MGAGVNREVHSSCEIPGLHGGQHQCRPCCPQSNPFEVVEVDYGKHMGLAQSEEVTHRIFAEASEAEAVAEVCHFDLELSELRTLPSPGGAQGSRPPHTFSSGAVYAGQWLGNTRHGYGVQVWPDGSRYEGQWAHSAAEGHGRFVFEEGDKYVGQWWRNRFHGLGSYYNLSETVYFGEWVDGRREGYGLEVGSGGAQPDVEYSGCFRQGHKDGPGVCKWPDGSQYYGEWQRNQIAGFGTYYTAHGLRRYRGQWHGSAKNGSGFYEWPDGRRYCGQYDHDQASGFGVFVWPDGSRYEGQWKGAKQHGTGRYVSADGTVRTLLWYEGRPVLSSGPDRPDGVDEEELDLKDVKDA